MFAKGISSRGTEIESRTIKKATKREEKERKNDVQPTNEFFVKAVIVNGNRNESL